MVLQGFLQNRVKMLDTLLTARGALSESITARLGMDGKKLALSVRKRLEAKEKRYKLLKQKLLKLNPALAGKKDDGDDGKEKTIKKRVRAIEANVHKILPGHQATLIRTRTASSSRDAHSAGAGRRSQSRSRPASPTREMETLTLTADGIDPDELRLIRPLSGTGTSTAPSGSNSRPTTTLSGIVQPIGMGENATVLSSRAGTANSMAQGDGMTDAQTMLEHNMEESEEESEGDVGDDENISIDSMLEGGDESNLLATLTLTEDEDNNNSTAATEDDVLAVGK